MTAKNIRYNSLRSDVNVMFVSCGASIFGHMRVFMCPNSTAIYARIQNKFIRVYIEYTYSV